MFGQDTADRFIVMLTHSTDKNSKAKEALKSANFIINEYFKFNNIAMFNNIQGD